MENSIEGSFNKLKLELSYDPALNTVTCNKVDRPKEYYT